MYLLVELYQPELSFTLILCKWSTFLISTVYSLHGTTWSRNCSFRSHTHTKERLFPVVLYMYCWNRATGAYTT